MRLDIGCGAHPRQGYESCDIRPLPGVQHVCSADALPIADASVDEIFTRHLIEHLTLKEFLVTIREWNRVLKEGAALYIICPNVLWHFAQVLNGSHESFFEREPGLNDRYWGFGSIYGWQQDEFDVHKFGYYFALLSDILEEAGFGQIEDRTGLPESIEKAVHHLEVSAVKRSTPVPLEESRFWHLFTVKH